MNGMALAVKIDSFGPLGHFRTEVERLASAVKDLPRAHGTATILMPGERGFATASQRKIDGIPLAAGTAKRLAQLAEKLRVTPT